MNYIIKYYCETAGTYYWIEDIKSQSKLEEEIKKLHERDIKLEDMVVYKATKLTVNYNLTFTDKVTR